MKNEDSIKEIITEETPVEKVVAEEAGEITPGIPTEVVTAGVVKEEPKRNFRGGNRRGSSGKRFGRREERVRPEFDQKIISMRRVTRVVAGGRRMSFSVTMVAGNRRGKVGVGTGKAVDTSLAIDKALRDAKKHMITVALTKNNSILHEVNAKYAASLVMPSFLPRLDVAHVRRALSRYERNLVAVPLSTANRCPIF